MAAKKAARDAEKEAAKALSAEEKRFQREVKRCAKLGLPPPSPMPKCAGSIPGAAPFDCQPRIHLTSLRLETQVLESSCANVCRISFFPLMRIA